jgi:RNA polymerase sigma-70 factor, ECF subfamily
VATFNKNGTSCISAGVTPEPDARLVRRAREGDRAAFEILVRRHLDSVYTIALAELADARDAEDAVQDAFITALERLDECRDESAFGAWLRQIVRNRAHTVRRREKIRRTEGLDTTEAVQPSREDPAGDLDRRELRRQLQTALGTLTETQRTVVLMHDLEGWKHREIAVELGIPEGTVRSHLFFARRTLRERLSDVARPEQTDGRAD